MNIPIRVLGPDRVYKGRKTHLYIDAAKVLAAYPFYAVPDNKGQLWRCLPEHEGAKLVSYLLLYADGQEFTCGNEEELKKIGLSLFPAQPERSIGFLRGDEGGQEVDIG